jgi:energy-coupling factor transport system ATP-binding protein
LKEPGLRAECLTVAAGSAPIVRCASFQARGGSLVLVTGASGSGKTSLLRAIAGLAPARGLRVSGSLKVEGRPAYIPQEPWYTIVAPYPLAEAAAMGVDLDLFLEASERLGVRGLEARPTISLSAGEVQRFAVALSRLSGAEVLLVDEVTSYLDGASRLAAARMLREAADEGSLVLVVDHDPRPWEGLADAVIHLDSGRLTMYSDVRESPLYGAYLEALRAARGLKPEGQPGEVVAEAYSLRFSYPGGPLVLDGVSFSVRRGEIVAVAAPSGRGKTTLLRILAGALKPGGGRVRVRGRRLYIPENPLLYLSSPTVAEELGGDRGLASLAGLEGSMWKPIGVLSSGERRRLAIASAAGRGASLILVDEPGVGLDPWSALKVLRTLKLAAERGAGIVVATHSPIIVAAASRVVRLG